MPVVLDCIIVLELPLFECILLITIFFILIKQGICVILVPAVLEKARII